MSIYPDLTLIIQIINFLGLLIILNFILYRPIRKIVKERNEGMNSTRGSIEDFNVKTSQHAQTLQDRVSETRRTGFQEKETLKKEGLKQEQELLQKTAASAGADFEKAKGEIARQITAARQSLAGEINQFSKQFVEKILGRSI